MSPERAARRSTPLARKLAARIRLDGPISVAGYMDACLHDPEHGYYRSRPAIGRAGDFITAPEISQVFGELIGLWSAVTWRQMGSPPNLNLVELGPGRGTLMRDALKAAGTMPAFREALSIQLVESNATLIELQRATLAHETVPITWCTEDGVTRATVGDGAAIVIANEFLDTFPIDQWILHGGRWQMRRVALGAAGELSFAYGDADTERPLPPSAPAREADIFETRNRAFEHWAARLAALGPPLAALFLDYGHPISAFGDTLQAVRAHRYEDPLASPGEADLTAQVDFAALAAAFARRGLAVDGPVAQAAFLSALGITERASMLMAANPAKAIEIEGAIARLMAPNGMGTRFQAIGIRSMALPTLPGFPAVDIAATAP